MEKNVIVVASVLGIQSPSGLQLIHGNRTVTDLKHVAKIKEAMKRGEIVPPIIIDKLTKLIIDGQHRFMAAAIGKERGGLTLLKRDIVLAWLGVRDLILSNMTIDAFTNLMKKHFVCPVSDKKVLYQSMYLDVYNKSKKKK